MNKFMKTISITLLMFLIVNCQEQEQSVSAEGTKEYTLFGMYNTQIFDEQFAIFKKATELTGVTLKSKISQNATDEKEAYNLMIASGDLPDIIRSSSGTDLETLGLDGGSIALEELVEEHAPNIKAYWKKNPDHKRIATAYDGHSYFIPYYTPKGVPGSVFFVRQDWLDKLGLPQPVTVTDYYNTLKAFRTQDPNGNGKMDEVPFFARFKTVIGKLDILFAFFQLKMGWQVTEQKISYDPILPEFKDAMRELSKWYKEGLIDPEFFTRDTATARDYMFGNNIGGMTEDWASTASYIDTLKDTVPGFNLSIILPPMVNGTRETLRPRTPCFGGWAISSMAKDPVGVIKYMDFWYSEEGNRLWNYGIENDQYTMVNGKAIFTDKILKAPSPRTELLKSGAQWVIGTYQDYDHEKQFSLPVVVDGYDMYIKENAVRPMVANWEFNLLKYPAADLQRLKKINAELDLYVSEMAQKWILGASDVDSDWDGYVKRINAIGLPEAIAIQEKALKLYNK